MNFINLTKPKQIFLILFLLFIYIIICAFSYVNAVSRNIQSSVFRLHVIANSDSTEDQDLKYIVRDNILKYVNSISENINSKEEIINVLNNNLSIIKEIAQNTVYENGYNYDIEVEIGNFPFPTKNYGDISLPAGFYDALRVKIGKAEGKNWWCVMFPPLCFVDVTSGIVPDESKETIKENLSQEEYNLLYSDSSIDLKFKFKLIETIQNININLAKS